MGTTFVLMILWKCFEGIKVVVYYILDRVREVMLDWRLFPVPLGLFKIGGAILSLGRIVARKISRIPLHVKQRMEDTSSLVRDLAKEE